MEEERKKERRKEKNRRKEEKEGGINSLVSQIWKTCYLKNIMSHTVLKLWKTTQIQ